MRGVERAEGTCRFRSSCGGDRHCSDALCRYGFCRFHFECYMRGEILANGQINERLTDQVRRRVINFHGLRLPAEIYAEPSNDRRSRNP